MTSPPGVSFHTYPGKAAGAMGNILAISTKFMDRAKTVVRDAKSGTLLE